MLKKDVLKWILFLAFFALAINYFYKHPELLRTLKTVNLLSTFIIVLINVSLFLGRALILKTVLNFFNIQVLLRESLGIGSFASMGNYMTFPGGGTLSKAFYLKKRYNFPYSSFISSMTAVQLIDLIYTSILGFIVALVLGETLATWSIPLIIGFVLLGVTVFGFLTIPFQFKGKNSITKAISATVAAWMLIRKDRALIVKLSIILLGSHLLWALELIVAFSAFSIKIGFVEALLLGLISMISTIVKITPANLGVEEVVVASSSHLLGLGFEQGLTVAILLRAISVIVIFLMAIILAPQLSERNQHSKS